MLVSELHRIVNSLFPPEAAMHGDNIGLQIASCRDTANKVLVCLEITDDVLSEAIGADCDCILTFHPLIFQPLARLDRSDRVSRLVADLVRHDVAVLCVHTAFDAFPQGTNHVLASKLGLRVDGPLNSTGIGILASLPAPADASELMHRVSLICGGPVRYCEPLSTTVRTIAIVGGSGMSFYNDAVKSGADVFITADVKYHAFHAASGVIGLADAGHYEMERFVPEGIVEALAPKLAPGTLVTSSVVTNPAKWISAKSSITLS